MIYFFTTRAHRYTLKGLRKSPHRDYPLRCRSYDWLFRQRRIVASACVFTDFDRLRYHELAEAARICRRLRDAGVRVLNDPARVLLRFDLLTLLQRRGINGYRVYPAASDPQPERFPVFLKCEEGHSQHFEALLPDQDALARFLEECRAQGRPLTRVLVTEFANTPIRDGVYRRHTVHRVGTQMIPGNAVIEARPFVKYGERGLTRDAEFDEAIEELRTNPHGERLRTVFDLAGIDYGRADFGFHEGRLAVYEINTNPTIGLDMTSRHEGFNEAVVDRLKDVVAAVGQLGGSSRAVRIARSGWHLLDLKPQLGLRLPLP